MEAIKKKMQAMKVEKDNLMDRCDNCEQVSWDYFLILLNSVFNIDMYLAKKTWSVVLQLHKVRERLSWTFRTTLDHLSSFVGGEKIAIQGDAKLDMKQFQAARDAKIRLEKTEEEATELSNKAKTLEVSKLQAWRAQGKFHSV